MFLSLWVDKSDICNFCLNNAKSAFSTMDQPCEAGQPGQGAGLCTCMLRACMCTGRAFLGA